MRRVCTVAMPVACSKRICQPTSRPSVQPCSSAIRRAARAVLVAEPLVLVDYLVLVHPTSLKDVPEWYRGEALLAIAGKVGTTRLIDNTPILVGPGGGAREVFSDPDAAPEPGPM